MALLVLLCCWLDLISRLLDHVQITALSRVLQIDVSIAYLDGRNPDGKVDFVLFENEAGNDSLQLLYR